MENYADMAAPLIELLAKGVTFHWGPSQEAAFTELKGRFTRTPILAYPNAQDPFVIDTDAATNSIGAVLSQIQDGEERVIA